MLNIFTPPAVLQCAEDELNEILRQGGKTCLLIGPERIFENYAGIFKKAFGRITKIYAGFNGECCDGEIERIIKTSGPHRIDFIAAFGGGKAIDAAKSAAAKTKLPLTVIPTSGATCSAFTSHSVIYSGEGRFIREDKHFKCPDRLILVREILTDQPKRLLAGGMADAAAKYYESTFGEKKESGIFYEFSKEILKTIFTEGPRALEEKGDVLNKINEKEKVLKISEMNILHTGIVSAFGGKQFRSSLAHAIANGFTQITPEKPRIRNVLHGELVGIGILTALFLLKRTDELISLRDLFFRMNIFGAFGECGEIEDTLLEKVSQFAVKSEPLFEKHKIDAVDIKGAVKVLCL
ncbi:MAG: iron-containing alcohol dehydrogenase [bacterium]